MFQQQRNEEKDEKAVQKVEKDIGQVIAERVELPDPIVNGITEHPNRLVGPSTGDEHIDDVPPIQTLDLWIGIDHSIIPIGKFVSQGIEVQESNKENEEDNKGDGPTSCQ